MRQTPAPVAPPRLARRTPNPPGALWQDGWYRFARHLPSPNHGPRPPQTRVDLLVVHAISLPPGEYGGGHVQRLFLNQLQTQGHPFFQTLEGLQVSAHFLIERSGNVWQFVSCDDRAWHAGQSCFRGRANCNDFSIGIELEGLVPGGFTPAQYESLGALGAALTQAYPRACWTGHEHIAPGRKSDPGPGFDWHWLEQALSARR